MAKTPPWWLAAQTRSSEKLKQQEQIKRRISGDGVGDEDKNLKRHKRLKMNPPLYPHTRSQGAVPPTALADEPEHVTLGRLGRLAPKWIADLLTGHLLDAGTSIFDVGCAVQRLNGHGTAESAGQPPHELLTIGHQCLQDESFIDDEGERGTKNVLSCLCRHCRYHFVFTINTTGNDTCGLNNYHDLFHHLVWVNSCSVASSAGNAKYHPVLGQVHYRCSAKACGVQVFVEVSEPRLKPEFLKFLQDDDRISRRLEQARTEEPERFADFPHTQPAALELLRLYVKNIAEGRKADVKPDGSAATDMKIDKRNKRFYIQFGDSEDCVKLFRYLEFEEVTVGPNEMWKVPKLEVVRFTTVGSRLAFFQDVQSEIETIAGKANADLKPYPALPHLRNALHIDNHIATTKSSCAYRPEDFDLLGITPDLHESIFWYAFTCQRQTDPSRETEVFEALRRLAQGRTNEELELKVVSYDSLKTAPAPGGEDDEMRRATEASLKDSQSRRTADQELAEAYKYFGFDSMPDTHDHVLGKFMNFCDNSPAQRSRHREQLLVIGRHLSSKALQDSAVDSMDLAEALNYLEVKENTDTEYIANTAQDLARSADKVYILVATALTVIAKSRGNNSDLINVGAIIMAEHDQSYGRGHGDAMDLDGAEEGKPVDMKLPAGLVNIRNTCYLNSILQYLYTVGPLRNVVLEWDKYGLENTEESLKARRVDPGSSRVERGEAFVGQRFATQLRELFYELEHSQLASVTPKQPLALAALKNAKQLETAGSEILTQRRLAEQKKTAEEKNANKEPPPLPARKSPAPPGLSNNGPKPQVTVKAVSDPDTAETSSTVSSQTLVNQGDEGLGQDYIEVTAGGGQSSRDQQTALANGTEETASAKKDSSGDVQMEDPLLALTEEEKIAAALDDKSKIGTDQQDVEEVIGNIIGHLRAAIKATGEDETTKAQRDPVMDLFFWTCATYSKKNGEKGFRQTEISPNRCVTAYPDENGAPIGLMQALDMSFQREAIQQGDDQYIRFSSIVKLPPILHIHIQRTKKDGGKNEGKIEIPEVLYLDRFMDSPIDSELFRNRRRSWNLLERLRTLYTPAGENKEEKSGQAEDMTLQKYHDYVLEELLKDHGGGSEDDEDMGFAVINPEIQAFATQFDVALPTPRVKKLADLGVNSENLQRLKRNLNPELVAKFEEELTQDAEACRRELDGLFQNMKKQKYRLQAVICHAGKTGRSGHYWVWIFDFNKQVWRRYNDERVTEHDDAKAVVDKLSTDGDPYYLAYVRDEDVDEMVDIPTRSYAEPPRSQDVDGDTQMIEYEKPTGLEKEANAAFLA